jgi:hypothetical protein
VTKAEHGGSDDVSIATNPLNVVTGVGNAMRRVSGGAQSASLNDDDDGEDEVAAGIDDFGRGVVRGEGGGADGEDAGIFDDDGAIFDDLARGVHRDEMCVGDDQIGGLRSGGEHENGSSESDVGGEDEAHE